MAEKRKRSQNFTYEEKDKLIKILALYKDTILNKKTDGTTNEAKANAWISVTARFNSSATTHRSKDSLLRVWEKLKTEAKLYNSSIRENVNKTGGGPCTTKIDPILEQVFCLMGRGCTGILNVRDSDADIPIVLTVEDVLNPLSTDITNTIQQDNNAMEPSLLETNNFMIEQPNTLNSDVIMSVAFDDGVQARENVAPASPTNTPISLASPLPNNNNTPIWSRRRRPVISQTNERTEVANSLCSSYGDLNQKRLTIEELKHQLLTEEIDFKRKLYNLQLEAATKELEIKTEVLKQIKDGRPTLQMIQSFQQPKQHNK